MRLIRWLLGRLILLIDALTSPRPVQRSEKEQTALNQQTHSLALYQLRACPFCVKVRRFMKRHALQIETREIKQQPQFRAEILEQGGKVKVPCLKILNSDGSAHWLYESKDIIDYLQQNFVSAEIANIDPAPETESP